MTIITMFLFISIMKNFLTLLYTISFYRILPTPFNTSLLIHHPLVSISPISIACLNINGLSSPSKQSSLINLFRSKHINILGLTETRLTKAAGNFMYKDQKDIYTVWSHHSSQSQRGGVGFMLSIDLAKHIQKVHLFKGRIISLDLFFKSFKLKVINLYFPVNAQSYLHERVETQMELDRLMQCAIKEQAACIIIGDMNIDPDRLTSSPNTSLLNFFS